MIPSNDEHKGIVENETKSLTKEYVDTPAMFVKFIV